MENWINYQGKRDDLVLSSRIRLARNIDKMPFPHKLGTEKGRAIVPIVEDAFYRSVHMREEYVTKYLYDIDIIANQVYLERHLISKNLINNSDKTAFIIDKNETVSVMINEEDHIRIQCITSSLNLEEAYDLSNKIDNLLEEKLSYAFDEKLGYITSCPTNIGTGLRASVMIHLPTLSLNNKMNGVINAVSQVGMTARGLYGEGSKAYGNIYQISNQVTLGLSEEEIISNLEAVVKQIINEENLLREDLIKNYKYEIEDRIYRALGTLKSAVLLNSNECIKLLSDVRLGMEMGIIKDVDNVILNNLLVDTQAASIQQIHKEKLSNKGIELNRAKLIKERLAKMIL
ncbi:protein arginine kinase [Clostridium sp. OS1-26]|uniref:protein arginine kinase n=1 Tax=Clostridium sp. OS1-26 TaxID=3070681 RepID=UPI0027DF5F80|nr:protein arginine kinase [Clostridium sp. OS1-26]WML36296.1 protein arginine kinase [Clostridium sp. OS1-26]